MRFRNNLQPGAMTVHDITRVIERKAPRKNYIEDLAYEQEAKWVQCNIDEPAPGRVMFYQMMADKPARVLSLFRNKRKIQSPPPASEFGLSLGSTRLHSTYKSPSDAPVQIPLLDPAEQVVLAVLLDHAHWPSKRIDVGHRWQRDIDIKGFRGTQTFEFVDMEETDGKAVARVTLFVEGRFTDALEQDYVFRKGQAILHWSRSDRTLLKMEARTEYERRRDNGPEQFELKLNIALRRSTNLSEGTQELVKAQLTLFADALKYQRAGENRKAVALCAEYRERWPKSIWIPAVDELDERARSLHKQATNPLTMDRLLDALSKTIEAYQAALDNYEYDLVDRTTEAIQRINEDHHAKLVKLTRDQNATRRAHAVFALAFSGLEQDRGRLEAATKDPSPLVRRMALAGLGARRSSQTNVMILLEALADADPLVRRHACTAVAACVSPEHFSAVAIVERLHGLIAEDEDERVRLAAIRAMANIGVPADIERLTRVREQETNQGIRDAIAAAIDRLRQRNA